MAKLCRVMYIFRRQAQYTEVYKDKDLILYLSNYHCLKKRH